MKKIISRFGLPIALLVLMVVVSACASSAPAPTATPVPTEVVKPLCSFVVPDASSGMGMSQILAKLGADYNTEDPLLLIDGANGVKTHMPQPGEVISLQTPAANCEGPRILARQVHFSIIGSQTTEISGFQSAITDERLMQAFKRNCELTRWFEYELRFSDNLSDGCNYTTAVQTSFVDGSSSCTTYSTFPEAYTATSKMDLPNIKWVAIASEGVIVDESHPLKDICPAVK